MNYKEKQDKWIKDNNIKIGDEVIVTRKAEDYENGWDNNWVPVMNNCINKKFSIIKYGIKNGGIELNTRNITGWDNKFPYFVLKKVGINLPNHLFEV